MPHSCSFSLQFALLSHLFYVKIGMKWMRKKTNKLTWFGTCWRLYWCERQIYVNLRTLRGSHDVLTFWKRSCLLSLWQCVSVFVCLFVFVYVCVRKCRENTYTKCTSYTISKKAVLLMFLVVSKTLPSRNVDRCFTRTEKTSIPCRNYTVYYYFRSTPTKKIENSRSYRTISANKANGEDKLSPFSGPL